MEELKTFKGKDLVMPHWQKSGRLDLVVCCSKRTRALVPVRVEDLY